MKNYLEFYVNTIFVKNARDYLNEISHYCSPLHTQINTWKPRNTQKADFPHTQRAYPRLAT